MNILVLNGSPKGEYSITLQTVRYLEGLYADHHFEVLHVGARIKSLEKDMSEALEALTRAELIVFAYPVYTFIAPYQLHRFIELVKQSGISLAGKFSTQITTSKHFYDVTAHRYIADNCADLGMKVLRGLSADMDDLLCERGQGEARAFFDMVLWSISQGLCEPVLQAPSTAAHRAVSVPAQNAADKTGDVVILTDLAPQDTQLRAMIDRFRAVLPRKTREINLREYPFRGGCLGCFHCAVSGECVYRDGFDDFLRNTIQSAQAIVYAFTIRDHSMGAVFKLYDDRQFCNGHRTVTMGMPVGYLVSGDFSREINLQTILEARAQVGSNYLAGIATDETAPDAEIDRLAANLSYALDHSYVPPQNFWGVGGMKIFRDLIWLMQGMMKADHKFYKSHGQYDFPQKKRGTMLKMYLVGAMLSSKKLRAKMGNAMNDGMLAPYRKVLQASNCDKSSKNTTKH